MKTFFRVALTAISAVAALFFVFWAGGAMVYSLHLPFWISSLVSLLMAGAVGRYVWRHTASVQSSLATSIVLGAFVLGALGFSAGFFGPIILTPNANQGPLLGIFITGPLGFLLGALIGALYWLVRGRRTTTGPNGS